MDAVDSTPCLVIGSGIAGINAILWLRDFGVPYRWVDPGPIGGTLRRVNNPIHNFPGTNHPCGMPIVNAHIEQLQQLDCAMPERQEVSSIQRSMKHELTARNQTFEVALKSQDTTTCIAQHIILATGTSYRTLGVPGEQEHAEFVSQSVSGDVEHVAGHTVGIVGGGDASFEGALILAKHGCTVNMFCRSANLRARPEFIDKVIEHPKITIWPFPTEVARLDLTPTGQCNVTVTSQGELNRLIIQKLFVRIGVKPNVPILCTELECDAQGYLHVDQDMATSLPGLLAAGDVTSQPLRAVVNAASDGARAARTVAKALGYIQS